MSSSLHTLSREDAEYHASLAEVEICTETWEERAAYRQQVKRAQSADKGKAKGKGHGEKRTGENQRMQSGIKRLRGELAAVRSGDDEKIFP